MVTQKESVIEALVTDGAYLEKLAAARRNDLLEIMDDRHGQASAVVISQLPTTNGMPASAITRSPMPSWIGSCTTHIACN